MREYGIENYLGLLMTSVGGMCEKHVNSGARGDPDRICAFPDGHIVLVETKWAEGEEPEPHQFRRHEKWRKCKVMVEVVRSKAEARAFMNTYNCYWYKHVSHDFFLP